MNIQEKIAAIPFEPGIYMMKNKQDEVMYVGKAKCLKKRIKQYFDSSKKSSRILKMVSQIENIEYIVTANELEALVLECSYIKEKKPKYNVMLKDDKTYPYIKITVNERYPSIYITRQKKEDGSRYFGPYTDLTAVKQVMNMIKELFPIKRCKYNLNKTSGRKIGACLYYHIGRCLGPCINDALAEEYAKMISQIIMLLEGKNSEIEKMLKMQIEEHSKKQEYEKAGLLKKRLDSIKTIETKQYIEGVTNVSTDIWGYIQYEKKTYLQIFKIRNSKILANENLQFNTEELSNFVAEIPSIIARYYLNFKDTPESIPECIYLKYSGEQEGLLVCSQMLSDIKKGKVEIINPKIGSKYKLIEIIEKNIKIKHESETESGLEQLSKMLEIQVKSIEAYDISNLKNEYIVGGSVTYTGDGFKKQAYRKYKIKSSVTQDDVKCMCEVISRRIKHSEWELPTVFAIDGGKTQVEAVKRIVKSTNCQVEVIGMVKNNKHKTDSIYFNGKNIRISNNDNLRGAYKLITLIQDEVHRFALSYHTYLRSKFN